jgi:pSer/pThr/pTyr-binding forkhead associated (FHA) protein
MSDPFSRASQSLTDALLQLDQVISLAESNVAAARQIGLPESAEMAARLPALTLRAREFLASIPVANQVQRWGENRRLLDQANAFRPLFAPYVILGNRVTAAKQAIADQAARNKAAVAAATRAQQTYECNAGLDTARKRYSAVRQVLADMQLQRGPGFDDPPWRDTVRSVASILAAQDVRISSAASSIRDGTFDDARASLDQSLGELQGAMDLAQRARAAANARAHVATMQIVPDGITTKMPDLSASHVTPATLVPSSQPMTSSATAQSGATQFVARTLLLIESRNGTLFRCNGQPTVVGRGLDTPSDTPYINVSLACDPGEAEDLGVSRRHAEVARQGGDFAVRDLASTNGTRLRRKGQMSWATLVANQWTRLQEGDFLQFGLLEFTVSLAS